MKILRFLSLYKAPFLNITSSFNARVLSIHFALPSLYCLIWNLVLLQFLLSFVACASEEASFPNQYNQDFQCIEDTKKSALIVGWNDSEPYQFNKMTQTGYKLTGMDIEIFKVLAHKVGTRLEYNQLPWSTQQSNLENGGIDVMLGATFREDRAKFAYFSAPYRYEQNSLFIARHSNKLSRFNSIQEFLAQVRLQNFKVGVIASYIYADTSINEFIKDPANNDIVKVEENDLECLKSLLKGDIDGFITDRLIGATMVFENLAEDKVEEISLNIKVPVHLMFSKKTTPAELVDHFNKEIKSFQKSSERKSISKTYLYPILLMQTIGADWFYIIGVIGTIAFAISGVAIAASENATLFKSILLAIIPSVGGVVMRDVILNRETVGILLTPSYIYYTLIVVILGFFCIKLLANNGEDKLYNRELFNKFFAHVTVVFDAIGQSAFVVTGVIVVVVARINPLELWGTFFAFLTSSGGTILRDLIKEDRSISCTSKILNAEIFLIWGLLFSIFLNYYVDNPDPALVRYCVIFVVSGAFLTRVFAYYFNIPNISFYDKTKT